MSRYVIIGGSGFVGSHTVDALIERGDDVLVIDLVRPQQNVLISEISVTDLYSLCNVLEPGDKILYLAAIPSYSVAEQEFNKAIMVNTVGWATVLRAGIANEVERFIYVSSGSVYSHEVNIPIREIDFTQPSSLYGFTKKWSEELAEYFEKDHKVAVLRYGHLYGPREEKGAIASFMKKIVAGEAPVIFGGGQTNDFGYISDIVKANLLALDHNEISGVYNVGTGIETTIEAACRMCLDEFDSDMKPVYEKPRGVDWPRFVYDISRISKLGYKPEVTLQKGIRKTADWWRKQNG